jgi:hypothetical protein
VEETLGRVPIAPWLEENVDRVTVLVDSAPEIVSAPADGDEELVQVPHIRRPESSEPTPPGRPSRPALGRDEGFHLPFSSAVERGRGLFGQGVGSSPHQPHIRIKARRVG